MSTCKTCGASVIWLTMVTKTGEEKDHIFDAAPTSHGWVRFGPEGKKAKHTGIYTSHWATCPTKDQHRKTDEEKPVSDPPG